MKKLFLAILVLSLLVALGSSSKAEGKLVLGVGADVLIPTGDFKNAYSTGFGGRPRDAAAALMITWLFRILE